MHVKPLVLICPAYGSQFHLSNETELIHHWLIFSCGANFLSRWTIDQTSPVSWVWPKFTLIKGISTIGESADCHPEITVYDYLSINNRWESRLSPHDGYDITMPLWSFQSNGGYQSDLIAIWDQEVLILCFTLTISNRHQHPFAWPSSSQISSWVHHCWYCCLYMSILNNLLELQESSNSKKQKYGILPSRPAETN